MEDFFGRLLEGDVGSHPHGDGAGKSIPGIFHVLEALGILPGELDKTVNVNVDGVLGGDLNENPCPANGVKGI